MLCSNPYLKPGFPVRCAQCGPCRVYFKRLWQGRLLLEWCLHDVSSFVTLTYEDKELPPGGNLEPADMRNFLKSLRKAYGPLRFFGVGEYGDRTLRPHYHLVIFGHSLTADQVQAVWKKGICTSDEFNKSRAAYVCGYVLKKLTKKDNPLLEGRHPEFARMSLKPGLGFGSLAAIKRMGEGGEAAQRRFALYAQQGYVRFLGIKFPLGRYLGNHLKKDAIGIPSKEDRARVAKWDYQVKQLSLAHRRAQGLKQKQHEQVARAQFRRKHYV